MRSETSARWRELRKSREFVSLSRAKRATGCPAPHGGQTSLRLPKPWVLRLTMDAQSYQALAVSLGLGLLVGLQREWRESAIAGVRTFPILSMLGTLTALLGGEMAAWAIAMGFLAVAALMVMANLVKIANDDTDPGMTTEAAALLMYAVGVALGVGLTGPAIVAAGAAAVLLHWKDQLHGVVKAIGEKEFRGLIHLVLISLVILPVLPDQVYGPYDVLNPYRIWRMVVLIVGISMVAYVAYRLLGARAGAILGGIFGGLISSTATTVSYARQTKETPAYSPMAALVIAIASTIVNVRVLIEIGAVAPGLLRSALLPITVILGLMVVVCVCLYFPIRSQESHAPGQDNPAQLKPALVFGAIYAVILFVVAAAKHHFGNEALYAVALISGLTDVDAITLSTAELFQEGRIEAETAWRVIVVAMLANLVFKAGAVAVLGSRRLLLYVAVVFGISIAGGIAVLLWWPDMQLQLPIASPDEEVEKPIEAPK